MRRGLVIVGPLVLVAAGMACSSFGDGDTQADAGTTMADGGPRSVGEAADGVADTGQPTNPVDAGAGLVRVTHFKGLGQGASGNYSVHIDPPPAANDVLVFVLCTVSNDVSAVPKTDSTLWTLVDDSAKEIGINVWQLVAAGSETTISGQSADSESFALLTQWRGVGKATGAVHSNNGSAGNTTNLGPIKITPPGFVVGFIGSSTGLATVMLDSPFLPITDGTVQDQTNGAKSLSLFGGYALESTTAPVGPHWSFNGDSVDFDGVIFALPQIK